MLNFPKTGSTFAREAIKKVYGIQDLRWNNFLQKTGVFQPRIFELFLPKINEGSYNGIKDQHGKFIQIPLKYRNKLILSIIRNPFSRITSSYFFKWWQNNLCTDLNTIYEFYPHFPDLSIAEYYDYNFRFNRAHHLQGISPSIELGTTSLYFIQFFSRDPISILKKIDEQYFINKDFVGDFQHIKFIHNESLVSELKLFMQEQGFRQDQLICIDNMNRMNESKYPDHINNFMELFDDELIEKVLSQERLLFELFPEYIP